MPRDPSRTVTFATVPNQDAVFGVDGEEVETQRTGEDGSIIVGEYEYESSGSFGSPTTADGELYADTQSDLIAVVTYYDNPKPSLLLQKLGEAADADVTAPEYPQEAAAQFYHTFGINGYTTSFREGLLSYGINQSYQYIKPDEEMKERAQHSRRDPSDDWLDEITEEYLEDGYYIAAMDVVLEEGGKTYSFSNPMSVSRIPDEEWDSHLLHLLFKRMRQLYTNTVPTTDEVLN